MVLLPCPCCDRFKVVEWDRDEVFVDAEGSCRCALSAEQHRHVVSWGQLLLIRRYRRALARLGEPSPGAPEFRARMGNTVR